MENISKLIQEAKPLYFKRKKRRRHIKAASAVLGCFLVAQAFMMPFNNHKSIDLEGLYTYLYDNEAFEQSFAFFANSMENNLLMDEYGLMAVL